MPPRGKKPDYLTPREVEALRLIADGLSNAAIAEAMMIRVPSVETIITRLRQKLLGPEDARYAPRVKLAIMGQELRAGLPPCPPPSRPQTVEKGIK